MLLGLRPYGVSFLFAGWDKQHGFQLYQTDPSGNYGGWKAQCIGTNSSAAQSILKEDYKPELTVDETLLLVTKILDKTMDSNTLTAEKCKSSSLTSRTRKRALMIIQWTLPKLRAKARTRSTTR